MSRAVRPLPAAPLDCSCAADSGGCWTTVVVVVVAAAEVEELDRADGDGGAEDRGDGEGGNERARTWA